jgi:hypothetical protein
MVGHNVGNIHARHSVGRGNGYPFKDHLPANEDAETAARCRHEINRLPCTCHFSSVFLGNILSKKEKATFCKVAFFILFFL